MLLLGTYYFTKYPALLFLHRYKKLRIFFGSFVSANHEQLSDSNYDNFQHRKSNKSKTLIQCMSLYW